MFENLDRHSRSLDPKLFDNQANTYTLFTKIQ